MAVTVYTICFVLLAVAQVGSSAHLRTLRQRRYLGSNPPYDRSGHPAEVDVIKERDFSKTVTDFDRALLTPTNKSWFPANTTVPKKSAGVQQPRFRAKSADGKPSLRPRFALPAHPEKNDKLNTLVALLQQLVIENDKLSEDAHKACEEEKSATGVWIDEGHGIEVADLAASHSSLSTALKPRIDDLKVFLGKLKIMQHRLKEHIDRVNIIYGKSINMDSQDTVHFPNILHQLALEEADMYSPNSNPIRLPEGHTFLLELFSGVKEAGETGGEGDTEAEIAAKADLGETGGSGGTGNTGSSGSTGSEGFEEEDDDDFQSSASEQYKVLEVMKEKEENKIREELGVAAVTAGSGASAASGMTGASASTGASRSYTATVGGAKNESNPAATSHAGTASAPDTEIVDGPVADEEDIKDTPAEDSARFLSGVVTSKTIRSRIQRALKRHNKLISLLEAQSTVTEDPVRVETNPPSQEASADILQLYRIAVEDEKKQEKAFAAEKAELAAIRVGLESLIDSRSEQLDQLNAQLLELEKSEGTAELTVAGLWPKLKEHQNIITNACEHMRTSRDASRKQEILLLTQMRDASVANGFSIDNITLPVEEPISDAPTGSSETPKDAAVENDLDVETDDADIPQTAAASRPERDSTPSAPPAAGVGTEFNSHIVDEIIRKDGANVVVDENVEQPVVQVP